MHHAETKHLFSGALYLHDARIAKFKNLFTICAYQVIMLTVFIRLLKLCKIFTELVFNHQTGVQQDLNIVIKGGPAHTVLFILHHEVQLLNVKMPLM